MVIAAVRAGRANPFVLPNNGAVFENREGKLQARPIGYYTEQGVPGQERIIVGSGGEVYYSPDHYGSIYQIA